MNCHRNAYFLLLSLVGSLPTHSAFADPIDIFPPLEDPANAQEVAAFRLAMEAVAKEKSQTRKN